jgi:hypothetical protein
MLRNARDLEQLEVHASDGAIGHVRDLFFDDQRWQVRYIVVGTGSWMEGREVLISPAAVRRVGGGERPHVLEVGLTRQQVERSPAVNTQQPVSREHEAALIQYYQWPMYWAAAGMPDAGLGLPIAPLAMSAPLPAIADRSAGAVAEAVQEDYHLRSVRAVRNHHIEARDGGVGHVEDFLVEDTDWSVRALVIDTRNWWPGKQVLIAPDWIDRVGWVEARVFVGLPREAIKSSPEFDRTAPIAPGYLDRLHAHYRWPRR